MKQRTILKTHGNNKSLIGTVGVLHSQWSLNFSYYFQPDLFKLIILFYQMFTIGIKIYILAAMSLHFCICWPALLVVSVIFQKLCDNHVKYLLETPTLFDDVKIYIEFPAWAEQRWTVEWIEFCFLICKGQPFTTDRDGLKNLCWHVKILQEVCWQVKLI